MERTNERLGRAVAIGALSPSMNFVNDEAEIADAIQIINNSGASALIVGLGAPKQEIWIQRYKHAMPGVRVFLGVGATIDYEAGSVRRAPPWMTRSGLEWLYRLVTEPTRYWRRYLRDLEYFWLLALDGLGLYKDPMLMQGATIKSQPGGAAE
jgi:exopolysaccharide biosynthesis WecB/TagA/CpsF family protein